MKNDDDGRLFVRCRLVACGFKTRREGLRDDLWVNEEPRTGDSAAVKPEDIGQEEDTNVLDGTETKSSRSLAATLPMSLDRSNVQGTKMAQRYNRVI